MKPFDRLIRTTRPTTERRRRVAAGGLMLLGAALLSASIFATGPDATPEERREKAWPVATVEIAPAPLTPMFHTYGRVESSNVATLAADVAADVETVHVREGQWVEAGALLVELEDVELALRLAERQAELDQARARLRSIETEHEMLRRATPHYESMQRIAEAKLDRHRELHAQRMISQAVFDEAVQLASAQTIEYEAHVRALADFPNRTEAQRALVAKTEALVHRARFELGKTRVTAPFSGPVLAVEAAPGMSAQPGRALVTVADAAHFEIRAQVPDAYSARFRRYLADAAPVVATLEFAGRSARLPLQRLAGNVRSGQSGLDAFFEIPPGDLPEIGRIVDLRVELPAETALVALPVPALYEQNRVYTVDGSRLHAVDVERVGDYRTAAGEYRVLVRSAELSAGQTVITTQLPKAISGLLVEVI